MDDMKIRRFSIRETTTSEVVAGLASVSSDNANLIRLQLDFPLKELSIGAATFGRRGAEVYTIVRVANAMEGS